MNIKQWLNRHQLKKREWQVRMILRTLSKEEVAELDAALADLHDIVREYL